MNDSVNIVQFLRPSGFFPALLLVAVAWFVSATVSRFISRLGSRFAERRLLFQQINTVLRFIISIGAIMGTFPLIFRLSDQMLLALGGTLAVAVGIATKDLAASIIAGLTILFDRPFQVGDRVTFAGYYGDVQHIGLRSVRLVTLDDNLVTIPNNKFLTEIVASGNAGALDMLVQVDFYVGVDQPIERARKIVEEVVTTCRYAFLEKPWSVLTSQVIAQNYFAARLRAKVYVLDVRYEKALESDITERVLAAFRREGVNPPAMLHHPIGPSGETAPPQVQPVAPPIERVG